MITRADMETRGINRTTAERWYRDRARNGHPEPAGKIGRADAWYEDEWNAWHERHSRAKLNALKDVDRSGDPDELIDAGEAARILGYANRQVVHASRHLGYIPAPDGHGKASNGREAPLWKRSTIWAAADGRVGIGGSREPRTPHGRPKPHPYAGDARLEQVIAELRTGNDPSATDLAAAWNTSKRTAERIIRAARDQVQP